MIGIIASLLGGAMRNRAESRANEKNLAFQREVNSTNLAATERLNMLNIKEARRAESIGIKQTLLAERRADVRAKTQRQQILADQNYYRTLTLKDRKEQRAYTDPKAVRKRLEDAGFNPAAFFQDQSGGSLNGPTITGAGTGSAIAATSGPLPRLSMSTARSAQVNAVTGFADAIGTAGQMLDNIQTLKQEKEQLSKKLSFATLQPTVGGAYERKTYAKASHSARPSLRAAPPSVWLGNGSTSSIAPDRDVEIAPYTSGAGVTEINNRFTRTPVVVPGADGEPWGVDEVMTAVITGLPQIAYQTGKALGKGKTFPVPNLQSKSGRWGIRPLGSPRRSPSSQATTRQMTRLPNNPPRAYYGKYPQRTGF